MNIVYDHQIFSMQKFGGISRYYCEIIKQFNKINDININVSLKYSDNFYLKDISTGKNSCKSILPDKLNKSLAYLINRKISIENLKLNNYDIFHPTYYDKYFLKYLQEKPFVITIYDMIHEKYCNASIKNRFTIANKKILANKASKIIAISQSTKNDIINLYGIDDSKIEVIYLATSFEDVEVDNNYNSYPDKYILFVGNRAGYKNFNRFLKATTRLLKDDIDLNVVCAGGGMFSKYELCLLKELKIEGRVMQISVDDRKLKTLYVNALAFVFPSLYEGFGLPILEAFSCSCPVILSKSSCFPEVAGDAGVYFNPNDEESIYKSIEKVIYNDSIRVRLSIKGRVALKKFTWEKTSQETKQLYRGLL